MYVSLHSPCRCRLKASVQEGGMPPRRMVMGVLTPVLCLSICAGHVPAATAMSFSWTRTAALCGAFIAVDRKNRSGGGFVRGWHVSMLIDEAACVCRETYIYIYIIYYIIYISSMLYIYPARILQYVCSGRAGSAAPSGTEGSYMYVFQTR